MVSLTIQITHPDVMRGDARTSIYNSIAQSMTTMHNGSLSINFERIGEQVAGLPLVT